jgi:hypothetical protein
MRGRVQWVTRPPVAAGLLICWVIAGATSAPAWAGSILREVWTGIGGVSISDLTSSPNYPDRPSSTNLVTDYFEAPVDVLDDYGQRLHGYLVPPVTGDYTFWIASDDGGELWLSTDDSPARARLIASVATWTASREWGKEPNQQSSPVRLEQGRYYYVAALMKEGGGGDNLAVRWRRPDGLDEAPISATHLQPWGVTLEPPTISVHPADTTAIEGEWARFEVRLSSVGPAIYQWKRYGLNLASANSSVLDYGPVTMADQGARFSVGVTNILGGTLSEEATLTVLPDRTQPELLSAMSLGPTRVRVVFSEPVTESSATALPNYRLEPGATVVGAEFGDDTRTIILTTSPLVFGAVYTLTVNGITDRAAAANAVAPGSQASFIAIEYAPMDIGSPSLGGGVSRPGAGAFDVAGSGADIGGTRDQMQFAWEQRTGDFDIQARVSGVTLTDPYVHAGLMLRESLAENSRFAAVFSSSPQLGCFFESRAATGAATTTGALPGGYPVNYPQTWLRLRRVGTQVFGFASLDGQGWTQLGSITLSGLPATVNFGLAVSSGNPEGVAVAGFREVGSTSSGVTETFELRGEPPGPSSRRTGMIFSEIMYHPKPRDDGRNLEFVELYNARSVVEDLSGWRLSGEVSYRFPEGFHLQAGDYVVVAAVAEDVRTVYGITNVVGSYQGALSNGGGVLRLRNGADAIRLEVEYGDDAPWPAAADGAGHSLVLTRPSYGESDPRAWSASERVGGSPGTVDTVYPDPRTAVVINEYLAHTDLPQLDYVELFNRSLEAVDLGGCVLTDDPSTNRFRIPPGTTIAPGGFLVFDETQLGFRLSAAGETVLLMSPEGARVYDAVRFGGQENGVSSGRWPDGADRFRRLQELTPGTANRSWRAEQVGFNEIMYHPITENSDEEFVELHNRGAQPVSVAGWRLGEGVEYTFPAGAAIPAGGYLVVARNAAHLVSRYPGQLTAQNTVGNYSGSLADSGERLTLERPDTVVNVDEQGVATTNVIHIVVGEVRYSDGGRWGSYADGGGSSLELTDPRADPLEPSSWQESDERQKAPWTTVEATGVLDHGNTSPNRLHIGLLGPGECLLDDLEVIRSGTVNNLVSNPGFESGATGWALQGNHSTSAVEDGAGLLGGRGLRIRAQGDCDTGVNSIRTTLAAGLTAGNTATLRAKVRWQAGWPEILLRLRGNHLELAGRMALPTNLGTPGRVNSRRVPNAGPAIYDVTHSPALPRANEGVRVTCRASDPDQVAVLNLVYRVDPGATLTTVMMRDDGLGGDAMGGDGVFSGLLPGRSGGTLVAFRIEAWDDAAPAARSTFPALAPAQECLVRWGDPAPFGSFAHYHLWSTAATESARNATTALNNTWRDATLVYGHHRVIYNAGFRDKGSPWHGGSGDFTVTVGRDDLLLGAKDRVFASTGNGGSEATGIRSQAAAWLAQQMGIPYLHAHYVRLYRNGGLFREIAEDLEQPNHDYAESWFPSGGEGDLYKVAMWFEFEDNNTSFQATGATIERFLTLGGVYKPARYRWTFQRRSNDGMASNFTNLFELTTALNLTSSDYVSRVSQLVEVEQWIRCYAFSFLMGNWDAWSYSVGQNMYAFKQPGQRWVLMPWDIDFVFGLGDGASTRLWGGQDPVINRMYDTPEFRRMVWRAAMDAANGPFLPDQYGPPIAARRSVLLKNGVTGVQDPAAIGAYIDQRRSYLLTQLAANDAASFLITSNNGNDFSSATSTVVLTGRAPFAVTTIEINGIPHPVSWIDPQTFRLQVPLTAATNVLSFTGRDRRGSLVAGATDTITITYTGALQRADDFVVLNEIHYNPLESTASFIEIHNGSTSTAFDLSGWRVSGVGYTFPDGAWLPAGGFLVLAKNRAAFATAYGQTIPVFAEFPGQLDNGGEYLALVRPGGTSEDDTVISDVRYDDQPPWPVVADGQGPSLQLLDPLQETYRVANWAATGTGDLNRVTPGRANVFRQALPPFPEIWINEVLPNNQSGLQDATGEREPWIELFNAGPVTVDLTGHYLTDDYGDPTRWAFPAGTTIGPHGFLLVWADGEPAEGGPGRLHANFRLHPSQGSLALVRLQGAGSAPAVLDYVDYLLLSADRSFGAVPDGEPRGRRLLHNPTPGAANDPTSPVVAVRINEFMARNTSTIRDPADGLYDDWIELHNAGSQPVDLTAYMLTDNLTNTARFLIPPGYVVPAGGFLLVWADNTPSQNQPTNQGLHVNFALSADGEQVGLFAPDGTLVDGVSFGPQSADVSVGRYPDGASLPLLVLDVPTPGEPNFMAGGNRPPVFGPLAPVTGIEMEPILFVVQATDPDPGQIVTYSLLTDAPAGAGIEASTGQFAWTPTEAQGPGVHSFSVRATDNGTPQRSSLQVAQVTVLESNRPPALAGIADQEVNEGSLLTFAVQASDPDIPANRLTFQLLAGAPAGAMMDAATGVFTWVPSEEQGEGSYSLSVRVTDDGEPPLSVTRAFGVTVREVNNPPVLPDLGHQGVVELSLFRLVVQGYDPDTPPSPLVYALDLAPHGAVIQPGTGEISWTPTEEQGPTNAIFIVRVTETLPPNLSSSRTFSVAVSELNQAPHLEPIEDQDVQAGDTVSFQATASDADLPAQSLTFALVGGPIGATIDASAGWFQWPLSPDTASSTNTVTVRVTDSYGSSHERSLTVRIRARWPIVINEIMHSPPVAGAQYVELLNISTSTTQDLSGLILTSGGFSYAFPPGIRMLPSDLLCVGANLTAFNSRLRPGSAALRALERHAGRFGHGAVAQAGRCGQAAGGIGFGNLLERRPVAGGGQGPGGSLQLIDPLRDNDRPGNWRATRTSAASQTLVPLTATWRYHQSGPAPSGWQDPGFLDSSWSSGAALLYVEDTNLAWPRQTLLTLGQWTYYFRARFSLGSVPTGAFLQLSHIIDDGAVFWLNGQELTRFNLPLGTVGHSTPAAPTVGDATLVGPVNLPGDLLRAGENVLAVEVHQANLSSSDIVMGCLLDLLGGEVPAASPGVANDGRVGLETFPTLRINEVQPRNATGIADGVGDRDPWIEIHNHGTAVVGLDGLFLSDDAGGQRRWAFPSGWAVLPGGFLVVFADGEAQETVDGEFHTDFRLPTVHGADWWVALLREQFGGFVAVDAIRGVVGEADTTTGRLPDADPSTSWVLSWASPGAPNRNSPELEILEIRLNAQRRPTFWWTTQAGRWYRIESRNHLSDGAWQGLGTVVADAAVQSFTDSTVGEVIGRFYRIVELP